MMATSVQQASQQSTGKEPAVSVIIPVGSRHEDPEKLCAGLRQVLGTIASNYEVIFVDDATEPETRRLLRQASQKYSEIRIVSLQRRMGEAVALSVGAQSARGNILITLDPYLHVALEELPKLVRSLSDGMDLVCAWRNPRQEGGINRFASNAFNGIARWLTKVSVHDLNCRVRVMRREILAEMPMYGDLHRFLPIFAAKRGYRWCEVQVPQQPGKREVSAFNPQSYIGRMLDLLTLFFLTRFVKRPLHFFGLIGAASFGAGFLISFYLVCYKFINDVAIGHRPLLLLGVLLIVVGIQIASIGLLGELLIFTHARDLKDYVVKETVGTEP